MILFHILQIFKPDHVCFRIYHHFLMVVVFIMFPLQPCEVALNAMLVWFHFTVDFIAFVWLDPSPWRWQRTFVLGMKGKKSLRHVEEKLCLEHVWSETLFEFQTKINPNKLNKIHEVSLAILLKDVVVCSGR